MRARDTNYEEIAFHLRFHKKLLAFIKYDGVRGLIKDGKLIGKSGLSHANRAFTQLYSDPALEGLDGEIVVLGDDGKYHPESCLRKTTSALSTISASMVSHKFMIFDCFADPHSDLSQLGYQQRYFQLCQRLPALMKKWPHLELVQGIEFFNLPELAAFEKRLLQSSHEGVIIRNPHGKYKYGTSGKLSVELFRLKAFVEEEIQITSFTVATSNLNPVQKDAFGLAKRSSHQANKTLKHEVGSVTGVLLKDCVDPFTSRIVFAKGTELTAATTSLEIDQRQLMYEHRKKLIDQVAKVKFFTKGVKDRPKFATFVSLVMPSDHTHPLTFKRK